MTLKKIAHVIALTFFGLGMAVAEDHDALSEKNGELSKSDRLVEAFMNKLISDTPFTVDDEVKYFGDFSFPGFMIMNGLGYMDQAGKLLKDKPKYSHLGELIRIKKDVFVPKGENYGYYIFPSEISYYREFPNNNPLISKTHFMEESDRYVFIIWKSYDTANGYMRTIFFLLKKIQTPAGNKEIIRPEFCMIDGKNLLELLGFKSRMKQVKTYGNKSKEIRELYLADDLLGQIQNNIRKLELGNPNE